MAKGGRIKINDPLLSIYLSFKHVLPRCSVRKDALLSARFFVFLTKCQLIITIRQQTMFVVIKHNQFSCVHLVLGLI